MSFKVHQKKEIPRSLSLRDVIRILPTKLWGKKTSDYLACVDVYLYAHNIRECKCTELTFGSALSVRLALIGNRNFHKLHG